MMMEPKRINLGGGFEKLNGWLNADLPREEQTCFTEKFEPDIEVDVDTLPLPFEDDSVDVFRMRDVMIETNHGDDVSGYEHWKKFAKEIERCLKPGGIFILIEHCDYNKPFDEVLNLVTREPGAFPTYIQPCFEEIEEENMDDFRMWISIYKKE